MKKPNIIFIQNDHQAYYRHGFDGGALPKRPNFDELASEGVSFENVYCATPLCAPTRRTVLTGQYPHEHKQYFNYCNEPFAESYLKLLKEGGYRNYYYGKWHAGSLDPLKEYTEDFFSSENYGNPYTTKEYEDYLKRYNLEKAVHKVEWAFTMDQYEEANYWPKLKTGAMYSCEGSWCGEHAIGETVTDKRSHESFFLATLAAERLEKIASEKSDEPFTLRLDFWGPHQPFFPTKEFIDMYDLNDINLYGSLHSTLEDKPDMYKIEWNIPFGENNRLCQPTKISDEEWKFILSRVYAHTTMVDEAGGILLKKLKELGLDDNTLIIWTTDHGDSVASHGGHFDKGSHMCEEVMRIPLAMKWKGVLPENVVREELVGTIDYPVTMLDCAQLRFNEKRPGRSILDIFKGREWRDSIMSESFGHGHGESHISKLVRHKNWKLVYHHESEQINELYDLEKDTYEMKNLYYINEYTSVKDMMIEKLKGLLKETSDPIEAEKLFV